ncbi:MAG: NusG domain II-containing protein [Erysipelothrix sp.]|nr:NusG domain II-containing protein [Erysipelothrix sp.]
MNKFDKGVIAVVLIMSMSLFGLSKTVIDTANAQNAVAVVSYFDKEIQRFNLNENKFHTVKGKLGDVVIEIKDGSVRVADEISPKNYCQTQGWVKHTNTPIVCLPNGIKIQLQNTVVATDEDIKVK